MTPAARRLAAAWLLATGVAAAACGKARLGREAEAAVRAYDAAVVVAYRTNDPRGLERVAGPGEVRKLSALIDLKRAARLALESELEELELLGVESLGPDRMLARTRERWRYWDRPLRPGMAAGPIFVADMWLTWELGREEGAWKVLEGRTERSTYLEPKGFRPGASGGTGADARTPAPRREGT